MHITGVPFLVVLCALALLPLIALFRTKGRWRLLCGVLALCGVLLVTAGFVNRHFGYAETFGDLVGSGLRDPVALRAADGPDQVRTALERAARGSAQEGVLAQLPVPGTRSGVKDRTAYVYLPPQYFDPAYAGTRFPVLELVHGMPGEPEDFLETLKTDRRYDRALTAGGTGPMVLVFPDGNGSRWRSTEGVDAVRGERAETYLADDVAATVERLFRVQPRGRHWGLAGFSVGGYAAVNLALRHPGKYGAAASLSGYFTAVEDKYTGDLFKGDERAKRENSPLWWARNKPVPKDTAFYLVAGSKDDYTWKQSPLFQRALLEAGADVELVVQPEGRHDYRAWRKALPDLFNWAWTKLRTPELAKDFPVQRP